MTITSTTGAAAKTALIKVTKKTVSKTPKTAMSTAMMAAPKNIAKKSAVKNIPQNQQRAFGNLAATSVKNSNSPKDRKFSSVSELSAGAMTTASTTANWQDNHLFMKLKQSVGGGPLIFGHRGGFFGPENSIKGFQGAIDNKLEGIEFDIWLSKDKVPMVLHGGQQGELSKYGMETEYVYNWTQEELQSDRIDIGEGERIPTLQQLLDLCHGQDMVLNIELKGPNHPDFKPKYDFDAAASIVYKMIQDNDIANKVMLSSFQPEIITAMKAASKHNRKFLLHRLVNDKLDETPDCYKMHEDTDGINMLYDYTSKSKTELIRDQGGLVGVWYLARTTAEDSTMYNAVMKSADCDVFFSDKPLEAMTYRDQLMANKKEISSINDKDETLSF